MERVNTVTSERMEGVLRWLNGQDTQIQENEVRMAINDLIVLFRNKCRELHPLGHLPRLRPLVNHPLSMAALLGEEMLPKAEKEAARKDTDAPSSREDTEAPIEDSEESNCERGKEEMEKESSPAARPAYDSILLVNAISYIAMTAGYRLSMSKAQLILWCLYGSFLASDKGRLEIEQPQVWKYGPVFPAAYRKGNINDRRICEAAWNNLNEANPFVAGCLKTKTHAMMGTPMKDLESIHKSARSPYGKMTRKKPDKWGMRIPDEEIRAFFSK